MPVIKQKDTNEDCAKTLASTENKLTENANTCFIEEKSVKDRSPRKQGVKRVNGDFLPTKATQMKPAGVVSPKLSRILSKWRFLKISSSNFFDDYNTFSLYTSYTRK
ncbi:hypothetical protein AVEN_84908-1 [Araneus ventricosus]|uniref:Uncharacterized protein n=1 Tax=Araneus ventricosus TaxID=182803 RepID=A0A4Y2R8X6_ARAVE|nr:hypothetical protein AVEN_84908-1 [Araneus ventricosus]